LKHLQNRQNAIAAFATLFRQACRKGVRRMRVGAVLVTGALGTSGFASANDAGDHVVVNRLAHYGTPAFLTASLGAIPLRQTTRSARSQEIEAAATEFITTFASRYRGAARNQSFVVLDTRTDELNKAHVRFEQRVDGIPVFENPIAMHVDIDSGEVYAVSGQFVRASGASQTPWFSPNSAHDIWFEKKRLRNVRFEGAPVLGYFMNRRTKQLTLAWRKNIRNLEIYGPRKAKIFVNARDGEFLHLQPLETSLRVETYDAFRTNNLPGTLVCVDEEKCPSDVSHQAHDNAKIAQEYFRTVFGRNSYDNRGATVRSTVDYRDSNGKPYNNAFWDGSFLVYGDGDGLTRRSYAYALDVVGHEYTHAVIDNEAGLFYDEESGALSEAWADAFGASISAWHEGRVTDSTWHIGRDVFINQAGQPAERYLDDPRSGALGVDFYPDRYVGILDIRGVHVNSGIAALPFVLLTQGGRHPRRPASPYVSSLGINVAQRIYYRAMRFYLNPSSTFADARVATRQAALDLYGRTVSNEVDEAWCAVGVEGCRTGDILNPRGVRVETSPVITRWLSGSRFDMNYVALQVPNGSNRLIVTTRGGSGDMDLYVRYGRTPSYYDSDCVGEIDGNTETCVIRNPRAGRWYISTSGFSDFRGVRLRVVVD